MFCSLQPEFLVKEVLEFLMLDLSSAWFEGCVVLGGLWASCYPRKDSSQMPGVPAPGEYTICEINRDLRKSILVLVSVRILVHKPPCFCRLESLYTTFTEFLRLSLSLSAVTTKDDADKTAQDSYSKILVRKKNPQAISFCLTLDFCF
jgi:hypothetical protein